MKKTLFVGVLMLLASYSFSQKYTAEKTYVKFYSHATLEDIAAENTKVSTLFNSTTGEIAFSLPINEFTFEKSLMQEHFNEKYMESEKFPKSVFQGKITGFSSAATGVQNVMAAGKLTIHGVTKDVEVPGTIEKQGDKLIIKSKFIVKLEDYSVKIPQIMWQNIAEQVEVTAEFTYRPQ
jgi:polyisoprenoid-binding protein YceI